MKKLDVITLFSFLLILSCQSTQNLSFDISFTIDSTLNKGKFLLVSFKNDTREDIMIRTSLIFKRMSGNDHGFLLGIDEDQRIGIRPEDFIMAPCIYDNQIPSIDAELNLHLKARRIANINKPLLPYLTDFDYIENKSIVPWFIFIRAFSQKQLRFKVKADIKGIYRFSYLTEHDIETNKPIGRAMRTLESAYSNKVDGYVFKYKGFKIDSLDVNF